MLLIYCLNIFLGECLMSSFAHFLMRLFSHRSEFLEVLFSVFLNEQRENEKLVRSLNSSGEESYGKIPTLPIT